MLTFSPIQTKNIDKIRRAYRHCSYRLCDYSLGTKLMWKADLRPQVAFFGGCMIVKGTYEGEIKFDFPVPCEETYDLPAALSAIETYCAAQSMPLIFHAVPESQLGMLVSRYREVRTVSTTAGDDYLYESEDLAQFPGKHYAGQRNHVHRFTSACPGAVWKVLTEEDRPRLERFFDRFSYHAQKSDKGAEVECRRAKELLLRRDLSWACVGYWEYEGDIIAVSLGEICGDTMIQHIEKALYEYDGVYPATVQAFARCFGGGVRYSNREDDTGDPGLRRSKQQYRPKCKLRSTEVYVRTELDAWETIPTLTTERLVLSALGEADKDSYNRLCTDEERNRYWGYDYKSDCPNPDENYFLDVVRQDFSVGAGVSWGIRLGEKFLGEVLLYEFDYHGGAQVGIRLTKSGEGKGYAGEALAAVLKAGLYGLGLSVIYAKCFRENVKSQRLLSAHMEKAGEDDTFFYFACRD